MHHELGKHSTGTNQTLSSLSTKYWIVAAREEILQWEKEYAACLRKKEQCTKQVMAPLPLCRLQSSLRAFTRKSDRNLPWPRRLHMSDQLSYE